MSQKPEDAELTDSEDTESLKQASDQLVDELSEDTVSSEVISDDSKEDPNEDPAEQLQLALVRIEEMKDGYVRAKADVENIQRRSQNEIISARKFAIEGFAKELLTVVDSLDQATKVEIDGSGDEAVAKMKEGLELTLKQFDNVMDKFGVTPVEAETGTKFDPEIHQAISMVPSSEVDPDHILSVMQKGFMLKDRLLRPAMVVIAQSA